MPSPAARTKASDGRNSAMRARNAAAPGASHRRVLPPNPRASNPAAATPNRAAHRFGMASDP